VSENEDTGRTDHESEALEVCEEVLAILSRHHPQATAARRYLERERKRLRDDVAERKREAAARPDVAP